MNTYEKRGGGGVRLLSVYSVPLCPLCRFRGAIRTRLETWFCSGRLQAGLLELSAFNFRLSTRLCLEFNQHDFGIRPHAEGRSPGSGAPVRKNEHPAEAMEPMNISPVNSGGDPGARRELSAVRMSANLKRNSRLLGDAQSMGRMRHQHTRAL